MLVEWIKSRKEISEEQIERASKRGKVKIRKGKSSHAKAKKLAECKGRNDLD